MEIRFERDGANALAPKRAPPTVPGPAENWRPSEKLDPNWGRLSLAELRAAMANQKARQPRIRVPTKSEYEARNAVLAKAGKRAKRPTPRIVWTLVCGGYQPELAAAWSHCTGSFRSDANQDRVFEECLFWIVTRSIDCFY
jgi:hypothetical protein